MRGAAPTARARARALRRAAVLGLLQGPAELLPISSSAHTTLVPWLLRWGHACAAGERRKSFEVALHAGAGLALAVRMRGELVRELARVDARRAATMALALAPPAIAGYAFERPIERRLGGPRSIAGGLALGGTAMALAERRARRRGATRERAAAGPRDGLALGLAQAAALVPGVSRNGAALASARALGFTRAAAQELSWHAGLPVLAGAGLLKGLRLARGRAGGGGAGGDGAALALGAGCAFLSTLASARALARVLRTGQPLEPYALYRWLLAALVVSRVLADRRAGAQ